MYFGYLVPENDEDARGTHGAREAGTVFVPDHPINGVSPPECSSNDLSDPPSLHLPTKDIYIEE
jgi:hypothetical protein